MELSKLIKQGVIKIEGVDNINELASSIEKQIKESGYNMVIDDKDNPTFVPKSRLDKVIQQREDFKTQAGELTGEIETLKSKKKDLEDKGVDASKYETEINKLKESLNSTKLESAIRVKAIKSGVHKNAEDDVLKLINRDKVKFSDDGKLEGLDEAIKDLAENKPFLFPKDEVKNIIGGGSNPGSTEDGIDYDNLTASEALRLEYGGE